MARVNDDAPLRTRPSIGDERPRAAPKPHTTVLRSMAEESQDVSLPGSA